ncbi:hypothetical protein ACGFS9_22975 [Streptomyces sp. NPDC048566]|uniref:hypothetical protein n=1 Tax=Streptomyces sp. NPDC048566 TaxID=3365569 RepID=UPI003717175D
MDVTALALRATAARPRVLLVTLPGSTAARLTAERALRLRDWPSAATPAQTDLLLVAGPDRPDLHAAVSRLWQDVPAPRARVRAVTADDVEDALEAGRTRLRTRAEAQGDIHLGADDDPPQRDSGAGAHHDEEHGDTGGGHHEHDDNGSGHGHEKATPHGEEHPRPQEEEPGDSDLGHGHGHSHGSDHSHGSGRHAEPSDRDGKHDHDGNRDQHDHGGHSDHGGHGGHGMEMPGGLPMAGQAEDRDGLTLDQLHLSLGPLLADWPAGLTVRVTLQGDVVQTAEVERLPRPGAAETEAFWVEPWTRAAAGEPVSVGEAARRRAAAHLDSLARLLSVAGWPAEAVVARRLRDDLLDGAPAIAVAPRLRRFARRVGRSRTLAWLTRGIGPVSGEEARAAGVSGPAARAGGDVTDRYRQWLADVQGDVARMEEVSPLRPAEEDSPRGRWSDDEPPSAALIGLLPHLLAGAELAAARLIVASFDPDVDELSLSRGEVGTRG